MTGYRVLIGVACLLLFPSDSAIARQWNVETANAAALHQALTELQALRDSGDPSACKIRLAPGTYRLDHTLELSGALVGQGLTLSTSDPGKVIFTGAVALETAPGSGANWRYQLPKDGLSAGRPRVILIDGQLRSAARHPNVGYHRIEAASNDRRSGFQFRREDIPEAVKLELAPCDLVFLHDWSSSRIPIASLDRERSMLFTIGPIGCQADHYAIDHFESNPRYALEGHPALADVAGEWYIDSQKSELVLVAGAEQKPPLVELPILDQLITTGALDVPVHGLRFIGIQFTGTRFPMPPGGIAGAQATMHEPRQSDGSRISNDRPLLSAAIQFDQPDACSFSNCQFRAIGNSALWIGSRAKNVAIENCHFEDIGGNAVNIGEDHSRLVNGKSWYQSAPEQVPTDNRITKCTIRRCGAVLPGSVAIWAALNRRLEISHNTISDCPYTGISLGWIWNDSPSPAAQNVIEGNAITRVMQVLSDGGGIYTLGHQPDSRLTGNQISNVPLNAGRAESNGMFLDEGSAGFTIQDNEFRRISKSPLRFHRAGKNVLKSNRWELETDSTPAVRFNNTPETNIELDSNEQLAHQKRIFLIGNSLTWDTRPPILDDYVDWHVDCGKSLQYIFDHPNDPCVDSSRLWTTALVHLQYDYLCVQPHYGSTLEQDIDVIARWMQMQPHATIVIHAGWARSESAAQEFANLESNEMVHSPGYYSRLIAALQSRYPDRIISQTYTTAALHQIAADIEAQTAPIASLQDLYRDAIHMTQGEGRYLMHNLMRVAVGQPLSDSGFSIGTDNPELKEYLDQIIALQPAVQPAVQRAVQRAVQP